MPVFALLARSTAVADTDPEDVRPTISHGLLGCTGGFTVVCAAADISAAASPGGEVGDDGKDPGDLGVAHREGGR